jgi:hypothetical protein
MKTKQCLNKNGEGCRKWFPETDKHFGNYPHYNEMGVQTKTLYKLCRTCKAKLDATYQREKGKGKLNKKELMHAGYDSDTEENYLKGMSSTTQVRWFSDVWRSDRYECI